MFVGMKQTPRLPSDTEFTAIRGNDASFDGRFFYGVASTKIFCRPSCISRAPKRENVRIFADTEAATTAGFRPCKRCQPQNYIKGQAPAADARLERARKLIDRRLAAGESTRRCRSWQRKPIWAPRICSAVSRRPMA